MCIDDFDRYCEENNVKPGEEPEAFAQWLANRTGRSIIGARAGGAPEFVAEPDDDFFPTRPEITD